MKIAMIGISGNPPMKLSSHNSGWTFALLNMAEHKFGHKVDVIKDHTKIHNYDKIIINEGVNFKGKFNFFGGVSDSTVQMLSELIKYKGDCYTYNEKIDWSVLAKRKEIDIQLDKLPKVETIYTYVESKLIIGDSHSLSIYKPGFGIKRIDGKTLHGFLKDPMSYIDTKNLSEIIMYFGNIDIRFHIFRQNNPEEAINKLIKNYSIFCDSLLKQGLKVTVQGLLPIEDESRKLPGTGLYLDKSFFGSQKDRQRMVEIFNEEMESNSHYYEFDYEGPWLKKPLSFDNMESKQSVHIRPSEYKSKEFKDAIQIQLLLPSSETQTSLFS